MIAALNFGAVLGGVAAGALSASLFALLFSSILTLAGLENGDGIGLVVGIVLGLATGGWVAGSRANHSERFHGMVTGLLLAFVVVVVARLGGSDASTLVVVWQAFLAIVISGFAGWWAGRKKTPAG
ncbi:MAG TPA: TIGR04086 family membrane protein [Acidimicrobiia bacterium]|nr:TIGR04086 family membrane protein [Acidimicrobiia bacterium]